MVVASGGFESNLEWLEKAWGPAARNFIVRGTPYNKGKLLKLLMALGAHTVGDPTQCHCVAIDGRAPKFDGGIVTRLDCVPLGIVVNKQAERFYDEGEDLWPKRYAIWGRLVAQQKIKSRIPSSIRKSSADSCRPCSHRSRRPRSETSPRNSTFHHRRSKQPCDSSTRRCGRELRSPDPRQLPHGRPHSTKSHWAQTIDKPPFYGYPLRPGITFTYLGVNVNERAEVQGIGSSTNIFAAGEIMAGNVIGKGYLAGLGMTIGSVFGRIAGKEAARASAQ